MSSKMKNGIRLAVVLVGASFVANASFAQHGDDSKGGYGDKPIQVIQVTPKGVETANGFDELVKFDYAFGSLEPTRILMQGDFGMPGAAGYAGYAGGGYGGMGAGMGMGGEGGYGGGMGGGMGMGGGGYDEGAIAEPIKLRAYVRRNEETARIEEIAIMTEPIRPSGRSGKEDPRASHSKSKESDVWSFLTDISTGGMGMMGGMDMDYEEGSAGGAGDMYGGMIGGGSSGSGNELGMGAKKVMEFHYLVDKRVAYGGQKNVLSEAEHAIVVNFVEAEILRDDILRLLKANAADEAKVDELEADLKKVIRRQYRTGLNKQKYEIELVEAELEVLKKEVARREAALERVVEVQAGKLVLEAQGLLQ